MSCVVVQGDLVWRGGRLGPAGLSGCWEDMKMCHGKASLGFLVRYFLAMLCLFLDLFGVKLKSNGGTALDQA